MALEKNPSLCAEEGSWGHLEPLCQKPQAALAKNPSNYSSNWKALFRCQVQLALGDLGGLVSSLASCFQTTRHL